MLSNKKIIFVRSVLTLVVAILLQACLGADGFKSAGNENIPSTVIDNEDNPNEVVVESPESGLTPVFFAAGHMRSSMYSCDGGQTWKGYKSADDNLRCGDLNTGNFDCDHDPTSVLGVTYGPSGFMITSGWGAIPGKVELSTDGENFSTVDEGNTWAGLAFGNGVYILNSRKPEISTDSGLTWTVGGDASFTPWNARKIDFVDQGEGYFISQAQSGDVRDMLVSRDNGISWLRPLNFPVECGNGEIAFSPSTVILKQDSLYCISQDQGVTWQVISENVPEGSIVFVGNEFRVYQGKTVNRSVDGLSWSSETLKLDGDSEAQFSLGEKVKYHSGNQKYISISQGWRNWYENTEYYYSDDGLDWSRVDKEAGDAPMTPHPVRAITTGYMSSCD